MALRSTPLGPSFVARMMPFVFHVSRNVSHISGTR
jgi:hypothetical protein